MSDDLVQSENVPIDGLDCELSPSRRRFPLDYQICEIVNDQVLTRKVCLLALIRLPDLLDQVKRFVIDFNQLLLEGRESRHYRLLIQESRSPVRLDLQKLRGNFLLFLRLAFLEFSGFGYAPLFRALNYILQIILVLEHAAITDGTR
jgi:hypothetical protein